MTKSEKIKVKVTLNYPVTVTTTVDYNLLKHKQKLIKLAKEKLEKQPYLPVPVDKLKFDKIEGFNNGDDLSDKGWYLIYSKHEAE